MPVVPLAFQEVERQVAALRQRLNRDALVSALAAPLAALLGLAAFVVAAAQRGTPDLFRWTMYAAVALLPAVLWIAYSRARQRWQSLESAARIADRRAPTADRVATTLWLARANPKAPFAGVLAADAVSYAGTWRPEWVAPTRFQRVLLLPIVGLITLIAATLLPPAPTPKDNSVAAASATSPHSSDGQDEKARQVAVAAAASGGRARSDSGHASESGSSRHMPGSREPRADEARGASHEQEPPQDLPEQIQDMIRKALRAEQIERARSLLPVASPLGTLPVGPAIEDRAADSGDGERFSGDPDARPKGTEDTTVEGLAVGDGQRGEGRHADEGRRPRAGEGRAGERGEDERLGRGASSGEQGQKAEGDALRDGERPKSADAESGERQMPGDAGDAPADRPSENARGGGSQKGSAGSPPSAPKTGENPRAGTFSAPEGLLSGRETARDFAPPPGAASAEAPKFKLTLFSFLGDAKIHSAKKTVRVASDGGGVAHREVGALHPDQMADDVLRRADVPPEYEEIVRRIYSARGESGQ